MIKDYFSGLLSEIKRFFSKIPVIETDRLVLRKIKMCDVDDMYEYSKRSDVTKYLLWSPHPDKFYTAAYIRSLQGRYRRGDFYDWAVVLKESGKMIGTCGLTSVDADNNYCEIGYVISPDYHNRGYATEAVSRVLEICFDRFGFHRVEAMHIEGNEASASVMKKCGMSKEGVLRDYIFSKNEYKTVCIYAILANEYHARRRGGIQD